MTGIIIPHQRHTNRNFILSTLRDKQNANCAIIQHVFTDADYVVFLFDNDR